VADREHDVGGARNTVGVTYFSASTTLSSGMVGAGFYINKPGPREPSATRSGPSASLPRNRALSIKGGAR
jgi:hypothetical protein